MRHVAPLRCHVVPRWCQLSTWPADLTTANRSAYNSKQDKLVRSVEQTRDLSLDNQKHNFDKSLNGRICPTCVKSYGGQCLELKESIILKRTIMN